ncbi:MAG: electron transport complex subunit E [Spirochaetaceae bacterium]|jgi:electron transport complex protein RnfE|nr:electron transport complex subunit E [Spirochaetaceae bacterium]
MKELVKGILKENPVFVLVLGLCPALAVTTQVVNAIGMGMGTLFVLLCSNIMISLLKKFIPYEVHIPAYIVIIASFVTIVDLTLQAYMPDLSRSLGVFVQLIVVNCIILGRAEAFASKHGIVDSIKDALGMGLGFTMALIFIALVREILGSGTITLFPIENLGFLGNIKLFQPSDAAAAQGVVGFSGVIKIPLLSDAPITVFSLPAGALLVVGYLKALFNKSNQS